MWNRTFLQSALGFSVLLFSSFSNSEQDEPQKPNIVYILADDLGYADVSPIAPDYCKIPTLNIERLAEEGIRFTNAHAGASVSTPTRYGLLTGRYS